MMQEFQKVAVGKNIFHHNQKKVSLPLIPAHFDECVELMATVWRLSGAEEYNRCRVPQYAHEVDSV